MSEHTIFVDTTGITYVEADECDEWVARRYEIGDRAIGFAQPLLPPPGHRYQVLMGQLTRESA